MTIWAQDEGRLGLKPVERRCWAPKGKRPVARQNPRYQWQYVYGFVHPSTGQQYYMRRSSVSTADFGEALAAFAEAVGAGPKHTIVLVLDGAGWHRSKKLQIPEGIHLVYLPPYSPQLQPAERLWPLLREALANRAFSDLRELDVVLTARCAQLQRDAASVSRLTHYHWWPADQSQIN